MTDSTSVGKRASSLDISPSFDAYSKVIIHAGQDDDGNEIYYEAGNASGRTLEIENEWGTQAQANNILSVIKGFQYQPFKATKALLDPAAELGDGITVNNVYSGIYKRETEYGVLMASNVEAPEDEEVDHEYGYVPQQDRVYKRQFAETKAQIKITATAIQAEAEARTEADEEIHGILTVQATQISAKVSKTGGSSSSFGWTLTDNSWSIFSGGKTVLKATSGGLEISGKITATSGKIGGFDIGANAIYKNISVFGGSQTTGVYLGTNGIQLGQGFKVDSSGNLTAKSGTFDGTVKAGNISYGGSSGYFDGGGIDGGTVTTFQTSEGINTSLAYADFANNVFNGIQSANVATFNSLNVKSSFAFGSAAVGLKQMTVKNAVGANVTIYYLGY